MPIEAHNNSSESSGSTGGGNTPIATGNFAAFLKPWIAENLPVTDVKITRTFNNNLYLFAGTLPFTTVSISTEITAGIWVKILTGTSFAFSQAILDTLALKTELATAISDLVDSSPGTLDTLKELAEALGDDPNFATTTAAALGSRLRTDINSQGLTELQIQNAITNLNLYHFFNTKTEIQNLISNKQQLIEVNIRGLIVQIFGKTDLTILQNNDLFRYQTADRYCVGVILDASNIILPTDLDNSNKIKLQYDA